MSSRLVNHAPVPVGKNLSKDVKSPPGYVHFPTDLHPVDFPSLPTKSSTSNPVHRQFSTGIVLFRRKQALLWFETLLVRLWCYGSSFRRWASNEWFGDFSGFLPDGHFWNWGCTTYVLQKYDHPCFCALSGVKHYLEMGVP